MTEHIVLTLLDLAKISVDEEELAEIVAGYPKLRTDLDLLYAPEFMNTDPYLVPGLSSMLVTL